MKGNNSKAREVMNWLSYFAMEVCKQSTTTSAKHLPDMPPAVARLPPGYPFLAPNARRSQDLAWLGMAGMQKDFRQKVCGLKTWNKYTQSHAIYYSQVPITYIWSPSLVPRPVDWPSHCEVVGFCSVELRKLTDYEPPEDLKTFLESGERCADLQREA
jgi:hypothetical protein